MSAPASLARKACLALVAPGMLLAPAGCSLLDPGDREAKAYVEQMQPIFVQNMELTREFVDIATEVKKGEARPSDIARRFEEKLVPQATALRDAVAAVHPADEELAATHAVLASAWTGRVEVYAELHRAWGEGDLEAFDAARRRNLKLKGAEERYLIDVNRWLAEHDRALDPYP
ncbi:MAG: hypothetical protein D6798_06575 [Deltaproteobacteria bacterium]|nr:MAG: hypothetical protein D6798_06575 [Deltaproteobacteria bacterium]